MPITVTAPHGALTPAGERDILPRLTAALIDASGQSGNRFFTPLVGGTVQFLPPGQIYAGGVSRPLILVELKLPDILHARDGAWGVGGRMLTNDDLVAGIMAAAPA